MAINVINSSGYKFGSLANGDMVEISSIPQWEREVLNQRELADSVSPSEALLAALATAPNREEVEQNKELAAKATAMQSKMVSGQRSGSFANEKQFERQ